MVTAVPKGIYLALSHLLLLGLVAFTSSSIVHTTYTISPLCLGNATKCLSLSNALKHADKYFTTNTTLILLPGDHNLQEEVSIDSISGLAFIGSNGSTEAKPRILCNKSSLSFSNVSGVHMESISFMSCSIRFYSTMAQLHSCWFENSTADSGGALFVINGSKIQLSGESRFVGNRATKGGAVYVFGSNVTFSGQTKFIDNAAVYFGGGLYVSGHSVIVFSGSNTFVRNTASYGGGVLSGKRNILIFSGSSTFYYNTADEDGGAVYVYNSNTVSFTEVPTFDGNTASHRGGAVYAHDRNSVNFNAASTFHNNKAMFGGAVLAHNNNSMNFNATSTFTANTASADGGAVYARDNNTVSFNVSSVFIRNTASYGGAVLAHRGNRVSVSFSTISTFHGNTASVGGSVYAYESNIVLFNGDSIFHNNTANKFGGAVYALASNALHFNASITFDYNKAISGGAMLAYVSNVISFHGNSTFQGNTAIDEGGAVLAFHSNILKFGGTCIFCYNTASLGGSLLAYSSNAVSFNATSTFHGNTARFDGGSVFANYGNAVSFSGTTAFHDNAASDDGGAVFAQENNSMSFCGAVVFDHNSAKDNGGAVSLYNSNAVTFSGTTTFHYNTAINGGAVSLYDDNTMSFNETSTFNNNAAIYGGAFLAYSSNFTTTSTFISNTARHDGGSVYALVNNTVSFSGTSTFHNCTAGDRGGAVTVYNSNTLSFNAGATTFHNNTAIDGGAVCAWDSNTLSFHGTSTFIRNTATNGGTMLAHHSNTVSFSGSCTFHDTKSSKDGGAANALVSNNRSFDITTCILFSDNTASIGGAVYAYDSNSVSFNANTAFYSNLAVYGGAVFTQGKNVIHFIGTISFKGNTADDGGALYAYDSNTVSFTENATFHDNIASDDGGAVYAHLGNTVSSSGACTFRGNTAGDGGALYLHDSNNVSLKKTVTFLKNTAGFGGAVLAYISNTVNFSGNSTFHDNTANDNGGAVYAHDSNTVSFNETNTFHNNAASDYGGTLSVFYSNIVSFSGTSTFHNNTANNGGAVSARDKNTVNFSTTTTFHNNRANDNGGAVNVWDNNTVSFNGIVTFQGNTASMDGGAVHAWDNNTVSFNGTGTFSHNKASDDGGAVYAYRSNTVSFIGTGMFCNNTAGDGGGAVYTSVDNSVKMNGNNSFISNSARTHGGGITSIRRNLLSISGAISLTKGSALFGGAMSTGHDSIVDITGVAKFMGNRATYGGGIFAQGGDIAMSVTSATFSNNFALEYRLVQRGSAASTMLSTSSASESGFGGAVHAVSSRLTLAGKYLVTANTATFGGGLAISGFEHSVVYIKPGTQIAFVENTAISRGGAIHLEDNPFSYCVIESSVKEHVHELCFFQVNVVECSFTYADNGYNYIKNMINLTLTNNTATESGGTLYGGNLEDCVLCSRDGKGYFPGRDVFQLLISKQDISELEIASDPLKVCICEGSIPNCTKNSTGFVVYPGELLSICVVAVGQMDGVVPSVIRAVSKDLQLTSEYKTQPTVNKNCTELHYPLLTSSVNKTVTLELYSDEPCSTSGYGFTVSIMVRPCPTGFTLSDQGDCSCEDRLRVYTQECHITDQTITRPKGSSFWVGVDYQNNISNGLILHPHCPFDYCTDRTVVFQFSKPDTQCNNRRSGVLCGSCQSGYSLALGSSRCISDCSNTFLVLLLAFIAAGIALVSFLFICNLTVAEGTISGVIFYANILAINQFIFFPASDGNVLTKFLNVFIAWLNLDLGIETCFFTGLDIYSKTWLQFAFPLYIWVLVGLIVYLADISTTVAKLLAHTNPVAVLATLFLLSYTKLLRTIMAAFTFTTLSYPEQTRVVWLHDGNIGYWDSKHVVLLIVSLLVFCVLYLPYTAFLVCSRWVLGHFSLKWISSAKQLYLTSFHDAYNAPYKDKHCYWTGLLLLVRFTMLLLSTVINTGSPQDPHTNLLVVVVVMSCLLAWIIICSGVYRRWYHNILETSFFFNLIFLSVGTYQVRLSTGNQAALVYTSIGIVFITFTVIVASAVMQRLRKTHFSRAIVRNLHHPKQRADDTQEESVESHQAPAATTSTVEIAQSRILDVANYRETALDLV